MKKDARQERNRARGLIGPKGEDLTPRVLQIAEDIQRGLPLRAAAKEAGVSTKTAWVDAQRRLPQVDEALHREVDKQLQVNKAMSPMKASLKSAEIRRKRNGK